MTRKMYASDMPVTYERAVFPPNCLPAVCRSGAQRAVSFLSVVLAFGSNVTDFSRLQHSMVSMIVDVLEVIILSRREAIPLNTRTATNGRSRAIAVAVDVSDDIDAVDRKSINADACRPRKAELVRKYGTKTTRGNLLTSLLIQAVNSEGYAFQSVAAVVEVVLRDSRDGLQDTSVVAL
jgi:hypothetical protein